MMEKPADQLLGTRIREYQILEIIGRGGMGAVYKARHVFLEEERAIKLIHAHLAEKEHSAARFIREAQILTRLRHPNLVQLYEFGMLEDQKFFMVMELLHGESVLQRIRRLGKIPLYDAIRILRQAAAGLAIAHEQDVIHRDISPDNLFLVRDRTGAEKVKVIDFGIAKPHLQKTDHHTLENSFLGKFEYSSPEQCGFLEQGELIDHRADIYSLGVTFYHMLAGQLPFRGASPQEYMLKHAIEVPPPVSSLLDPGHIPVAIDDLIMRMLAKNRNERPASMSEVNDALGQWDTGSTPAPVEEDVHSGFAPPQSGRSYEETLVVPSADRIVANNLPVSPNPLIGREKEIPRCIEMLLRPDVRMLTLTGPGGIGKTRLALEIGRNAMQHFRDGVYFIRLDAISDPALVNATICGALGIREVGAWSTTQNIEKHIHIYGKKGMVIILDNFEHLLPAGTEIAALLNRCPSLKILVTSRSRLNIYGEFEFPVPALKIGLVEGASLQKVGEIPALHLFCQRAVSVRPDFQLTPQNVASVWEICAKLDGLPLALELAAARIKLLTPQEILSRLENTLKLLSGGATDLPSRQQSIRAAIAWSYEMLDEKEKKTFVRLSIFRGSFTLEAVEALCQDLDMDILEALLSLVNQSMLSSEQKGPQTRFTLLQILRDFGYEHLVNSGEYEAIAERHARNCLRLAKTLAPKIEGTEQEHIIAKMQDEHDNIRAALDWFVKSHEIELAAELTLQIWKFWELKSYLKEGRARISRILQEPLADPLRLRLYYAAGVLADAQGDYSAARSLFEQNLKMNRAANDDWGTANSLNNVAIIAARQGDYDAASALLQETAEIWKKLTNQVAVALTLNNLGNVYVLQRQYDKALALHEESFSLWKKMNDNRGLASSLTAIGDLEYERHEYGKAFEKHQEALIIFEQIGYQRGMAASLLGLAKVLTAERDFDQAHGLLTEALDIFLRLKDKRSIATVFEAFAQWNKAQTKTAHAALLTGAATAYRESIGAARTAAEEERFLEFGRQMQEELGSLLFEKQRQTGYRMALENVAYRTILSGQPE